MASARIGRGTRFEFFSCGKVNVGFNNVVEIVREDVQRRISNNFYDLCVVDSEFMCGSEVIVGKSTTFLDELRRQS